MKPSKKQNNLNIKNNLNVKKNKGNGNDSSVPIQSFFKAAPKSFVVDKTTVSVNPKNGDRQFYVDLLKNKLDGYADDEIVPNVNEAQETAGLEQTDSNRNLETNAVSESEIHNSKNSGECTGCIQKAAERDELEDKYKQEYEKRKELKKVYMNLNVQFTELYVKHQSLLKAKSNNIGIVHGQVSTGITSDGATSDEAATVSETTERAMKGDDDTFTEAQLKFLQYMSLEKKNDCTFILQCLKYAYKNDLTVLASKTLKGTAERIEITAEGIQKLCEGKAPLTPEKVNRIKSLFIDRISKCEIHSADYVDRMKDTYVNKLFAAGIGNISKKL